MSASKLIYSYLVNRTQTGKVKGEPSTERQMKSGIPKGSLLGVLSFNVYLKNMLDPIEADLFHFADDNYFSSVGHLMVEAKALLINEPVVSLD